MWGVHQIIFLCLMINFLFAESNKSPGAISGSRYNEDLIPKESFGDRQTTVLSTLMDLVKEVNKFNYLVKGQSEKIDRMDEQIKRMESKLVDTVGEVESRLIHNIEDMESKVVQNVAEMGSKVANVDNKIEVWRSEVRLISQQKLTWHNNTHKYHYSDFAVDGVYTLSNDMVGVNPMQHIEGSQINHMLIIDLGGFFKIHSVKVWNRIDCCQDRLGVLIFADEELIGGIYEAKRQYNFNAKDKVYARKIYLKQTRPLAMNYIEVQVFGTGPYQETEVKKC